MKTADEIKEAMLHCSPVSCRSTGCPYKADTPKYEGDMPVCRMKLWHDMRHLIQQLEAQNAEKDAGIKQLESGLLAQADVIATMGERIQQLEAERDAAVETIYEMAKCITDDVCEWCDQTECERLCMMHATERPGFKWRGIQKEGKG